MPKPEFLRIPIPRKDRERLQQEAEREHVDLATWARQALLRAVEKAKPTPSDDAK